jgi:preprotein translocase subunit SecG
MESRNDTTPLIVGVIVALAIVGLLLFARGTSGEGSRFLEGRLPSAQVVTL